MFQAHLVDNPDEVAIHFTRQVFTGVTGDLHSFWGSVEYLQYLKGLFNSMMQLSATQTVIGGEIGANVYLQFLENVALQLRNQQIEEPIFFNVHQMLEEGQSKVRHVGAWAVKK